MPTMEEETDDYYFVSSNATTADIDDDVLAEDPPFIAHILAMPSELFRNQIIIIKVVAFLSAVGSAYIIGSLVTRHKLHRIFDRLLLALSISDLVSSLSFFLASWSIPSNPPVGFDDDIWQILFPQAVGNTRTCTAQGLFLYLGITAGYLFTGCIALSFLFQVRFGFSKTKLKVAEYIFFGVSVGFPLVTSVFVLVDQGFNPNPLGYCFLYEIGMVDGGKHIQLHILLFQTIPTFLVFVTVVVCMVTLFWSVRTQEQRTRRFSMTSAVRGRHQKRVFVKSLLYIGAILPWFVIHLIAFLGIKGLISYNEVALIYAYNVILPMQGVFNFLIYSDFFHVFQAKTASITDTVRSSVIHTLEKFGWLSSEEASKRLSVLSMKRAASHDDDDDDFENMDTSKTESSIPNR